jgi:hypothetical protein
MGKAGNPDCPHLDCSLPVHGYEAHGVDAKEQQIQAHSEHSMKRTEAQFVVCIKNTRT